MNGIHHAFSQNHYGFDTTILVGKDMQIFRPRQIKIDHYNNKFVVGCFKGALTIDTFTISTSSAITNNPYEYAQGIFVAKYDSLNKIQWIKKFAEADTLYDMAMEIDHSNNLVANYVFFSKAWLLNDSIVCNGSSCVNIIKYDNDGNIIFKKVYAGNGNEGIGTRGLAIDEDNKIYACVNFGIPGVNNYEYIFGNDTLISNNLDPFILKSDSNGNIISIYQFGGPEMNSFSSLEFENGYIYVVGRTNTDSAHINNIVLNYPSNYDQKKFIAKLDTTGTCIWAIRFGTNYYGGMGSAGISKIAITKKSVYFAGAGYDQTQLEFLFDGGGSLMGIGAGSYNSFIARYDFDGHFKWSKMVPNCETAMQIDSDSLDQIKGVGSFGSGNTDIYIISYDSLGNIKWNIQGGGFGIDRGSGIASDSHGKLFIVGGTTSSGGCYMGNDTLYPPANQSTLFFASLDSIPTLAPDGIREYQTRDNLIKVYPNPAYNILTIVLETDAIPFAQEAKIEIYNTLGQMIQQLDVSKKSPYHQLDVSNFYNGIYYMKYIDKHTNSTKKFIVQH
ncbi:MAG: T9SS type A sorting domain-containing protein [Chitinophagaceae bacterium]|nr:T9SS type A sorting domain-containing protein [Chitinophagaceae bacterium]